MIEILSILVLLTSCAIGIALYAINATKPNLAERPVDGLPNADRVQRVLDDYLAGNLKLNGRVLDPEDASDHLETAIEAAMKAPATSRPVREDGLNAKYLEYQHRQRGRDKRITQLLREHREREQTRDERIAQLLREHRKRKRATLNESNPRRFK